jgi:hypothetical protein
MRIRFFKIARMELDSAVDYYNNERPGLGYEFLYETFAAIDRVRQFPEASQIFSEGTRRCLVRRFPYGVVYSIIQDTIMIVAVAHLHRAPDYWIDRL